MKKLIIFLLVFVSLPTFARSFSIEMIIFKRNVEPSQVNESWPQDLEPINFERAFSYRDSNLMSQHKAGLLPSGYYNLNRQYQALERHAGFKPLVHVAWYQNDRGESTSPVLHIQAGEDFSDKFAPDGRSLKEIAKDGTPTSIEKEPLYELDGTVQVYVQHYLYLKTNLDLRIPGQSEVVLQDSVIDPSTKDSDEDVQVGNLEPVKPKVEVQDFLNSYRMQQKRKIRSGETHYLDNPFLGVIINIRKM
ncbi:peptidoglycan binding protein CsiV [Vibrio litoralis]|uniref:peptidoglycan binding protein CsiV n=1 Tax=Vibrio litoralis TaxID=335972 RepID=UPI0018677123|nr:peptidoglycan binding protein CsiV [Vibrio litoralis]